jgi:hypothetical protein
VQALAIMSKCPLVIGSKDPGHTTRLIVKTLATIY